MEWKWKWKDAAWYTFSTPLIGLEGGLEGVRISSAILGNLYGSWLVAEEEWLETLKLRCGRDNIKLMKVR
jgi:hypothetical protein